MSTSLLYHGFGLRGYRYRRTEYQEGAIIFTIDKDSKRYRCPQCGSRHVTCHGCQTRIFRSLPIGKKPTWIRFSIPRVHCPSCRIRRQITLEFADPRRHYTHAFERLAVELCQHMTIQDVAQHLQVGWDVIKDIHKRYLHQKYARPKLRHLKQIAIDEISIAKGHRYVTLVLDLESGAVVFVGEGKGADALEPFWRRLRASRARLGAVATDMSAAYIDAVRQNLPDAIHVFDRFHVVKLINEKVTEFRRQLYNELTTKMHQQILKGIRWLLLKRPENLDESKNERQRLDEALEFNKPLATVYYLKEDLRQFWDQGDKETTAKFLQDWIKRAESSGIAMLKRFANTLAGYRSGLLAYYDAAITTGPLEGTNNKIKTMKRQAYGFRDHEFFKLKILGLHETKYALGVVRK